MSQTLSLSAFDPTLRRTTSLLDRLFPPPRAFGVRLWDGTELPAECPAFSLVLNHPGALRRMFTPPIELSLGEAFIYGDFDIEGDIFSAFHPPKVSSKAFRNLIRFSSFLSASPTTLLCSPLGTVFFNSSSRSSGKVKFA